MSANTCPSWCDGVNTDIACDGQHVAYFVLPNIPATAGDGTRGADGCVVMPAVNVGIDDRRPEYAPSISLHIDPGDRSIDFNVQQGAQLIQSLMSRYVDLVSELPPFRIDNDEELAEQCKRVLALIDARRPKRKNA